MKNRVNMRLEADLVDWARRSAKERSKSFTAVVEEALREAMEGDQRRDAVARRVLRNRRLHAADL